MRILTIYIHVLSRGQVRCLGGSHWLTIDEDSDLEALFILEEVVQQGRFSTTEKTSHHLL